MNHQWVMPSNTYGIMNHKWVIPSNTYGIPNYVTCIYCNKRWYADQNQPKFKCVTK